MALGNPLPSFSISRPLCVAALTLSSMTAQALSGTHIFTAVDGVRTGMDIGGVWDGTTEVSAASGDGFSLKLANSSGVPAQDLELTLSVGDAGLTLVPADVSVGVSGAGCGGAPAVSASQMGTAITFSFDSGAYDLPDNCTLNVDYGLTTTTAVGAGTYALSYQWDFTDTGGAQSETQNESIEVFAGALVLNIAPLNQIAAVGDTVTWTVELLNAGLGGLLDVVLDETSIDTGGGALQITALTPGAGCGAGSTSSQGGTGADDTLTLPYLDSDASCTVTVQAQVSDCLNINNPVRATERVAVSGDDPEVTEQNITAQVTLDLTEPLIAYTAPTGSLSYTGAQSFSLTVDNTGRGASRNLTLETNLPSLGTAVTVTNADWSYDAASGTFTYTANGATLANNASTTLTFDIAPTDVCANPVGGTLVWSPNYTNVCGDAFATPTQLGDISGPGAIPSLSLDKALLGADQGRIPVGDGGIFRLIAGAASIGEITSDPLQITDVLDPSYDSVTLAFPAGFAGTATCSSSGTTTCLPGDTLTWTLSKAEAAANPVLDINFAAPIDTCEGGNTITNNVAFDTATSSANCPLDASDSAAFTLSNAPETVVAEAAARSPSMPEPRPAAPVLKPDSQTMAWRPAMTAPSAKANPSPGLRVIPCPPAPPEPGSARPTSTLSTASMKP